VIAPVWDIAYTTDDASDATPTWTTVSNTNVRSVTVSRGRDDELGQVDAGTATLVLNNRSNHFNPVITTGLRPMNRWRLRATHNAVTYDIFFGYAESYEQQWPATGIDAVTVVRLVDEFKVLALRRLPTMDPPRDSYADLVQYDDPQGYWRFGNEQSTALMAPTVGNTSLGVFSGVFGSTPTPIVGDFALSSLGFYTDQIARSHTGYIATASDVFTPALETNGPGDAGGLGAFTFELWFKSSEATPAADRVFVTGPTSSGPVNTYLLILNTTGKIRGQVVNSSGTIVNAIGATSISADTWYHVALVYTGANVLVYLNGVQDASAAQTGTIAAKEAAAYMYLGPSSPPGGTRYYDEPAFYRYALPAARLLAHYTAGVNRGFPAQDPGARITSVLTAAGNTAASSIRAGSREMIPTFMRGQSPLDELRNAEEADSVDSILFIAKDGTITFLDDGHRSVSPWNTVQATFDDDGTDLPYTDVAVDYSETFLANTINVTRTGGTTSTSSDATSISRYHSRTMALTDLPITTASDQSSIATALLAKYKDPLNRVTSITIGLTTSALIAAGLDLELADRIRILRTPVGGGTRIDQTAFVQSINLTATPNRPWQIRLGVSPL
jgi:hypothetical protein